ncbi:hypothetical protein [Microbacterium immunditiarum]|uniref:TrbL/VirB6 plasmid conjugal transfer protein n=1 Tax=Microbacterium immunditiarum TaxID=337480 RepID=A0A7Y9GKB8_9MICO|nr:hypothetical protein [Microbacterium immunditiarum]NYE18088.1 hypothetical protein [Microbacterium immunditiarum]
MRRLPALTTTALALALVALPASAHADATMTGVGQSPRAAVVAVEAPVSGEPWSAPGYPVECKREGDLVSCTPVDPSFVVAQQCYLGVVTAAGTALVCTTFEDHRPLIEARGGKPTLVDYGCSFGDLACAAFEGAGRGMAISATAAMYVMATNVSFNTESVLWDAAVGEWAFWRWAVLFVVLLAMIWTITAAAVNKDREELVGALLRCALALPMVPFTLWVTGHLVNAVDDMTWYILSRDGITGLFRTMQSVMWAGGQAAWFFAYLMHGLLLVAMVLLIFVFMFRNLGLAALVAIGPVAWMLFPLRRIGPDWVIRYISALLTLLLTGPLTIGFVSLIVHGLAGVKTIWDPAAWPLVVGLAAVAVAPFAIFGLFSFLGGVAVDSIGSRMGATTARAGSTAAHTIIRMPTRLASSPAGQSVSRGPAPAGGSAGGASSPRQPAGATASAPATTASPARSLSGGSTAPLPAPAPAAAPASPARRTS